MVLKTRAINTLKLSSVEYMMGVLDYYEEVPLTQWATIAIGIFIAALTPTAFLQYIAVQREPLLLWLYVVMDLFFIVMMLNFRKMLIRINDGKLVVSFGLIKKKVKLEDIRKCEVINASLSVYTGMGVRYGGDGSLGFVPRLGKAIRLSFEKGRAFVFSTNESEKLLAVLHQYCEISDNE